MIFSLLFVESGVDSYAYNLIYSNEDIENTWYSPILDLNNGTENTFEWTDGTSIYLDKVMDVGKYYRLWVYFPMWCSDLQEGSNIASGEIFIDRWVTVGGNRYHTNGEYATVVFQGTTDDTISLGADWTYYGSYYDDNLTSVSTWIESWTDGAILRVYELTDSEVSAIVGTDNITDKIGEGVVIQEETLEVEKEQAETSKGILSSITDFFGSFFQNLIDSVIGIFVPSSEDLGALFDRLNTFFSDTFGFLYYPFDFIVCAFDVFINSDSSTALTLPGFSIMGYEVWSDMSYDLSSDPIVNTILGYVRIGTGATLGLAFVNYLRNFFDKRFGGGGN